MKPALILATITFTACSPRVGYVDIGKAVSASADGRQAIATANETGGRAQSQLQQAMAAAAKLTGDAKTAAEQAAHQEAVRSDQAEDAKLKSDLADVNARAGRILDKLRAEHRFAAVQPALAAAPDLNLTAELTRRLDAGDGKTDEQEEADLTPAFSHSPLRG